MLSQLLVCKGTFLCTWKVVENAVIASHAEAATALPSDGSVAAGMLAQITQMGCMLLLLRSCALCLHLVHAIWPSLQASEALYSIHRMNGIVGA